jgi:hypothetical protein
MPRSRPIGIVTGSEDTSSRLLGAYILSGIVLMATWTQFDAIGWRAAVPVLVVFAIEHRPRFWHRAVEHASFSPHRWFPRAPRRREVLFGIIVALPLFAHLAATLGEEFPYGGDEGYHFSATRTFARHLVEAAPWLAGLALVVALMRRVHRRYLLTLAVTALWAMSVQFGPEMTFARYPAAFYFLASPLNIAGEVIGFTNPHVNNHVVNTLSVPVWLFVLRPLVVRAWPDLPALVTGLLLFFQPTVLTYFGGGGLEPWALVLLLTALEAAVRLPADERWSAVLVAGCASWVKEPAILFLPLVWLLAMVEWRGWVPVPRRGAIPLGIAAATPFVTYYFVRHTLELPRFYAVVSWGELLSPARAREWFDTVHRQFGDTGLILLTALAVFAMFGALIHRGQAHIARAHLFITLFSAALIMFFYVDVQGIPYTGYGRYLMFPYFALAAAVLVGSAALGRRSDAVLWIAAAFVLVCQAMPLAQTLSLDWSPDYTRNSLEWHRCLIRLPFRELAAQIDDNDSGRHVTDIRLVTITLDTQITPVAYPGVAGRYAIRPAVEVPESTDCRCLSPAEAVIAAFEYRANFDAEILNDPRVAAAEAACVAQLENTCERVVFERAADGTIVAGLGLVPTTK